MPRHYTRAVCALFVCILVCQTKDAYANQGYDLSSVNVKVNVDHELEAVLRTHDMPHGIHHKYRVSDVDMAEATKEPRLTSQIKEFEKLLKHRNVDRHINPAIWKKSQGIQGPEAVTEVEFGIGLHHVLAVDVVQGIASMVITLRAAWQDERLEYASYPAINTTLIREYPYDALNTFWTPDLYLPSAMSPVFLYHERESAFVEIRPEGKVYMSYLFTVTAKADYNLATYPFDSQNLQLHVRERTANVSDVIYKPKDNFMIRELSVDILPEFEVGRFEFVESEPHSWRYKDEYAYQFFMHIFIRRHPFAMIMKSMFPIFLVTIGSSATYWIDEPSDGPPVNVARMSVAVVSLLSCLYYYAGVSRELPKTAEVSIVDLFFLLSILWCLFALAAMIIVNGLKNYSLLHSESEGHRGEIAKRARQWAGSIDKIGRTIAPLLYTLIQLTLLLYGYVLSLTDDPLFHLDLNEHVRAAQDEIS